MVPAYRFEMLVEECPAGTIRLRLGTDEWLTRFAGQTGFCVNAIYRGRRLAGRSVRLVKPLAAEHGLGPIWLTCNPDNHASKRVMLWLGATLVEIVNLPSDYDAYARGEWKEERYRLER
jgi:tagatose 1,6-diphosphate aldolase